MLSQKRGEAPEYLPQGPTDWKAWNREEGLGATGVQEPGTESRRYERNRGKQMELAQGKDGGRWDK